MHSDAEVQHGQEKDIENEKQRDSYATCNIHQKLLLYVSL